jgi:hypothetical protein
VVQIWSALVMSALGFDLIAGVALVERAALRHRKGL